MENSKRHPNCDDLKVLLLPSHHLTEATAEREFGPHKFKKGEDNQRFLVFLSDELCSFAFWKSVQTLK